MTLKLNQLYQWELPNDSIVVLPDGEELTFKKMDGMYAHWLKDGELKIGNYRLFERRGSKYYVI